MTVPSARTRALRAGLLAAALAGSVLTATAPAQAGPPTVCNATLTGGSYAKLVVGDGDVCVLDAVSVGHGGIQVSPGGSLITDDSEIAGNVHTRGAQTVQLIDTNVGHNIMVTGTRGRTVIGSEGCLVDPVTGNNIMVKNNGGTVAICFMDIDNNLHVTGARKSVGIFDNVVDNNVQLRANSGPFGRLRDNQVGGHIQIFRTTSDNRLFDNTAGHQVMCRGNSIVPTGSGNVGDLVDQCVGIG